jgi:hypothetical protein
VPFACVWRDGEWIRLYDLVPPESKLVPQFPHDINGAGQIAGEGYLAEAGDGVGFVLTPVFPIPGDTNCDELVNVDDLLRVLEDWGPCHTCSADINGDFVVGPLDLFTVIENWSVV